MGNRVFTFTPIKTRPTPVHQTTDRASVPPPTVQQSTTPIPPIIPPFRPTSSGIGSLCNVGEMSHNPFLKFLKDSGVKVFSTAVALSKCGNEWKDYGTCCDEATLAQFAKKEVESINESSLKFPQEIENLLSMLRRTTETVRLEVNKTSIFIRLKQEKDRQSLKSTEPLKRLLALKKEDLAKLHVDEFLPFENGERLEKISKTIDSFSKYEDIVSKNLPLLIKNRQPCIEKLSNIRSSSYCTTCSGRSHVFFKEQKAIIKIDDCRITIDKCHGYWSSLIEIIDGLELIKEKVDKLKELIPKSNGPTKHTDFLSDWLNKNDLRKDLNKCQSNNKCDNSVAASICTNLISIKKPQTLMSETKILMEDQRFDLNKVSENTKRAAEEVQIDSIASAQFKPSHLMIQERLLQEGSSSSNDTNSSCGCGDTFDFGEFGFSADVIVINPPFCRSGMPMNMDDVFP